MSVRRSETSAKNEKVSELESTFGKVSEGEKGKNRSERENNKWYEIEHGKASKREIIRCNRSFPIETE